MPKAVNQPPSPTNWAEIPLMLNKICIIEQIEDFGMQ
jgi:hypothetical protein